MQFSHHLEYYTAYYKRVLRHELWHILEYLYYDNNEWLDREWLKLGGLCVSEYAQLNPHEDRAETFAYLHEYTGADIAVKRKMQYIQNLLMQMAITPASSETPPAVRQTSSTARQTHNLVELTAEPR